MWINLNIIFLNCSNLSLKLQTINITPPLKPQTPCSIAAIPLISTLRIVDCSAFEAEGFPVFLLAVFALFFMNRLEECFKSLFNINVFLGRGLAHKHQIIILGELLYLFYRDLPTARILICKVHFVGYQCNLAGLLTILPELTEPVIETLKTVPIRQIKYQEGPDSLAVVPHHY